VGGREQLNNTAQPSPNIFLLSGSKNLLHLWNRRSGSFQPGSEIFVFRCYSVLLQVILSLIADTRCSNLFYVKSQCCKAKHTTCTLPYCIHTHVYLQHTQLNTRHIKNVTVVTSTWSRYRLYRGLPNIWHS